MRTYHCVCVGEEWWLGVHYTDSWEYTAFCLPSQFWSMNVLSSYFIMISYVLKSLCPWYKYKSLLIEQFGKRVFSALGRTMKAHPISHPWPWSLLSLDHWVIFGYQSNVHLLFINPQHRITFLTEKARPGWTGTHVPLECCMPQGSYTESMAWDWRRKDGSSFKKDAQRHSSLITDIVGGLVRLRMTLLLI